MTSSMRPVVEARIFGEEDGSHLVFSRSTMEDRLDADAYFSPSKRLKLNRNSYAAVTNFASGDGGIDREPNGRLNGVGEAVVRAQNGFSSVDSQERRFAEEENGGGDDDDDCGFCDEEIRRLDHSRRPQPPPCLLGVTSTSERLCSGDLQDLCLSNGGDSGFNDFTPPSSDMETSALDLEEPDSSTAFAPRPTVDDDDDDDEEDDCGDVDDVASTVSHLSGFSDLSEMSGQDWKATAGPMSWVQRQMMLGISPRTLLQQILPQDTKIPDQLDDLSLWKLIVQLMNEPPRRKKLRHVNTFDDVLNLVRRSRRIIVLTGAGVSVSCGIPDFRSHDGIYARLAKDFPDLPDPQAMFDIQYFRRDPRPFYKFAKEIYPGLFQPSPCHRFIKFLEASGKLLRNYTQNIDTLEQIAGIQNVIECHGSFATASCLRCKHRVDSAAVRDDIFNQTIPHCPKCTPDSNELAIMKPDIVFFGEGLSDEFHNAMNADKDQCDLLIVIGSSLKVRPVALIPSSVPGHVPQILINRERLPHLNFDVELLGDCDVIINEMCRRLGDGWNHLCYKNDVLTEIRDVPTTSRVSSTTTNLSKSSDLTSESNRDPCDSTSFPHRFAVDRKCDSTETPSSSSRRSVNPADSTVESDAKAVDSPCTSEPLIGPQLLQKPRSISTLLPQNSYLFCQQSRYIFHGAEVYELVADSESSDDDNDDDDDEEEEEEEEDENSRDGDGDAETASSSAPSSNENTSDVSIYEMDHMSFSSKNGGDEDARDNLSR